MEIRRGDIVLVRLDPVVGSEQGKTRPGVIIQNDDGNKFSPTTIVAPVTSKVFSKEYPTNVFLPVGSFGLSESSTVLLNQVRTVDKVRIIKRIGILNDSFMKKVDFAVKISLGLD